MDEQRWRQVRKIFDDVLKLPPAERKSCLDRLCGDDTALKHKWKRY